MQGFIFFLPAEESLEKRRAIALFRRQTPTCCHADSRRGGDNGGARRPVLHLRHLLLGGCRRGRLPRQLRARVSLRDEGRERRKSTRGKVIFFSLSLFLSLFCEANAARIRLDIMPCLFFDTPGRERGKWRERLGDRKRERKERERASERLCERHGERKRERKKNEKKTATTAPRFR